MTEDRPVADAAARARALTPDQSFIVQAPAGSGKTELLTQRYLRLLSCVDHPEEIVAITFTRKAASEMRSRVLGALERAQDPRPDTANEAVTWALARAALARDAAMGWNVIASPERLRVGTIDALCAALSRRMPTLSRLGAPPAVTGDAEALHMEAARELIARIESDEAVSPSIERLLQHLDNDLPKVERLIAAMLARRDQWMRHLGSGDQPPRRESLEASLKAVIESALETLHAAVPADAVPELLAVAGYAAHNLRAGSTPSPVLACLDLVELPGTTAGDIDKWRGLASLLLTLDGDWRKAANASLGFPAPSGTKIAAEKARFKHWKDRFSALVDRLAVCGGLLGHLTELTGLPPARYEDGQWEVVEALYRLLPLAVAELWVVFQNRGEVDFTQVSWSALRALGTRDEPTDLALTLDYRIRHMLIDEFQDTSQSQYELLDLLTAGWTPGDGRTLFVVGDPMQSIYRFRQAEVGLFLRAWHRGMSNVRLEPLSLTVNFRSQQGIVDWVNDAFERAFPAQEDIAAGAVTYSRAVAYHPARRTPAVTLHPVLRRDDGSEAARVVALVREAIADPTQETIAILVRSRGHLFDIAPRLRGEGLRFRAVEIERLGHRSAVQDLLALTRALIHPGDRLSWLAVLRAPWCGLELADLDALAGRDRGAVLWESIEDPARIAGLSANGRARLDRLRAVMSDRIALLRRRPLRRLVEGAWIALGGPACAAGPTDLADALCYLDLLEQMEAGGDVAQLDVLSDRVDELFARPDVEATARLQLMTIHKAKGLQFHTVIVPGLGRQPKSSEPPLLAWAERPDPDARTADLVLAPIRESGRDAEPIFEYLRRFDAAKGRYEDGRVLYVAATRAIDRLHLLGHTTFSEKNGTREVVPPPRGSLLHHLWSVVQPEFERALVDAADAAEADAAAVASASPAPALLRRLPLDWRLPAMPPPPAWQTREVIAEAAESLPRVEFAWAREVTRHVGTAVHGVLQQLGREGLDDRAKDRVGELRPSIARRLAELGVPPAQIEAAVARAEAALTRTLADDRGRWILDRKHADAHVEYGLSGVVEGEFVNVILDRTFVDADAVRWIIDYKASSHEGGGLAEFLDRERERYAAQLERYAALMEKIDARPIRLGLYFPLLGGWREWDAPART